MKSKVKYSTFSIILTTTITIAMIGGLLVNITEPIAFFMILIIFVAIFSVSLWFAPISITADKYNLTVKSLLKLHQIPITKIVSVERYRPLPGTIRICASGGFMGYWGIFRDNVIGKYIGFWGKNEDCFLVTLQNGKKYLLGCNLPDEMVNYLMKVIKEKRIN